VFASKRDVKEPLYATLSSNPANEYQHMWQTGDNRWKTRTGPSSEELGESRGKRPPLNQCIGLVVSSLKLDSATWEANFDPRSRPPPSPDRGRLRRLMSPSSKSFSSIHVHDNPGWPRRGLFSFLQRATESRTAIAGDDYILLQQEHP
jgi:hypothetical protein